jgi:hypothetical protein
MNFASVEDIAAAILYEGYILYPYRATATKNRQRWNFGTLYPREYAEAQKPPEPFGFASECLLEADESARVDLRVRFLQLIRQQRPSSVGVTDSSLVGVTDSSLVGVTDSSLVGVTDSSLEWDEGVERTGDLCGLSVHDLVGQPISLDVHFEAIAGEGHIAKSLQSILRGRLTVSAEGLSGGVHKLRVELQNVTGLENGDDAKRDEALAQSFVSAHLLLGVTGGEFVSLLDTPDRYREVAATCKNTGVFPVLVGGEGQRTMMLCSPIILYDYPKIAPESPGDFFDGTEMDEMLALRVLTLTDEEKQEMRNGDARARQILERTEAMTEGHLMKVHGAVRGLRRMQEDAS